MRIGFFTDTYLPVVNGVTYVMQILQHDLEAAGHEVWVLAPEDFRGHLPKQERVIRYKAFSLFYRDQFNSVFWPPKQLKIVEQMNLDAIIAFTPTIIGGFGAYCSVQLGIPYVAHYGTDLEEYAELYKPATIGSIIGSSIFAPYFLRMNFTEIKQLYSGYFKRRRGVNFYRFAARHMLESLHQKATAVITPSEKMADKLKRWPIQQKIKVIPTGVDALPKAIDFKKHFAKKYNLISEDEIILYVGRLSVEKNLDLLLDSFELIAAKRPKAKLLLVGDFQYRHNLERQAAKSNFRDRIIFTGQIDRMDLGAVYSLGDVFVLPSLTDCQALVLNEAAHAGLPLIWCDKPTLNPVLQNGRTGLQADTNKADLAQKIEALLADKSLAQKYGQAAAREASKYTEAAQTEKLVDFLAQLTPLN